MRYSRDIFWILAVAIMVACGMAGCASGRGDKAGKSGVADIDCQPLELSDQLRFNALMLEANTQRILGNTTAYYDLLDYCLQLDPQAPEALYQMGFVHKWLETKGILTDTIGFDMVRRATQLAPQNISYLHTLVNFYLMQDSLEQAMGTLERLAKLEPRNTEVLATLVDLYEHEDKYAEAIDVLNRLEVIQGKTFAISYRKYECYEAMGKPDKAFAELDALCKEYPNEPNHRLIYGDLLMANKRPDEALKLYQQVQEIDSTSQSLQLSMMYYYKQTDADSLYREKRDAIIYSPHTDGGARTSVINQYIEDVSKEPDADSLIAAMFCKLDSVVPNDIDVLRTKATYLASHESNESEVSPELIDVMERIIDLDPTNKELLFTLIQYYGERENYSRLEDICRKGVLNFPDELVCHYYLGVACYQQDHKNDALKAFQDGVQHKTKESSARLVAELFGLMGDLLHELGRPGTEVYAAYDSSLVYNPDNASCLNNYAYYLSLDNTMLDKAEDMSYRSLRIEPNNKTYLDTYAWILFMKERYVEAQAYIDRVCPPDSADSVLLASPDLSGVVLEHAGDIAVMNGNNEQALRFWLLAQQAGGSGITATLPRKIKLRKYIKP